MMLVASCIPFPFSASCDAMLAMLVCAIRWLSLHLYTLAYMSMHESCLLVCYPYFNTMKSWTFDRNLHLERNLASDSSEKPNYRYKAINNLEP